MDESDEKHLESLYKRRGILRQRIDFDEEQIATGVPSVHVRFDLTEAKSQLSKVEEEIEDQERKQRYDINKISRSPLERGEDEPSKFIRFLLEKDQKMLQAITKNNKKEGQ